MNANINIISIFPFLTWIGKVDKKSFRSDFLAGLTGAVVVLPQGVAFAMIAGLPPEYGLYTAIIPPIVAALFGSSLHLVTGPTTPISIVVFASISPLAEPGSPEFIQLALSLTCMAGLFQLALGIFRMGILANFISHSVIVGFTAGAAILIATNQLGHVFGFPYERGESFIQAWINLPTLLGESNLYVVAVSAVTLAVVLGMKMFLPKWPGMLFAMVAGAITSVALGAQEHLIPQVGSIPASLPPLTLPPVGIETFKELTDSAMAIAMLGLIEAVSIARSVAMKSRQRIDGNQEFIGQGAANMIGSFFSCYAASGSFTRSGLNYDSGAKTPMASIMAAVMLALILLLVAPLAEWLPIPSMGAIVLVVAYNLIDKHHIRTILKTSRAEGVVLITTFLSTLFVELEFAIYIGVLLSLVMYLNRTSKPDIIVRVPDSYTLERAFVTDPDLAECPEAKIIRIDGSIYFGCVNHVEDFFHSIDSEFPNQWQRLIVCSGINFIDVAGAEALAKEAERLKGKGGRLYLYGVKERVIEVLGKGGYLDVIGRENFFCSKKEALAKIYKNINKDKCAKCGKEVFIECGAFGKLDESEGKSCDRF